MKSELAVGLCGLVGRGEDECSYGTYSAVTLYKLLLTIPPPDGLPALPPPVPPPPTD